MAGLATFKGIKHHHDKKVKEQEEQRERERQEIIDQQNREQIEENKREDDARQQQQEEEKQSGQLEIEREARIAEMETPGKDLYLYPPGLREEIEKIRKEEEEKKNSGNRPIPNPNPNPDGGGGGPDGGGDDPNDPDNPYDDIPNRPDYSRYTNPYEEMIKQGTSQLVSAFAAQLLKEKEQEKDKEKMTKEEIDQLENTNTIIKQQLEAQKKMIDVLQALGVNEKTEEQSLVELDKIEQELEKMEQQNAPVKTTQYFSSSLVSF